MRLPKDMGIIQIEVTNACMKKCSNCTRFCGHHKKPFFMDFETFKRSVDSLIGFEGTIGIMGGEPTLHPEFDRFMDYLYEKMPECYKKKENVFIHPQKDYLVAVHDQEGRHTIARNCGTGMTVQGCGLWSAMPKTYKKHYEKINDVFNYMAVNDHTNVMYHQPALITRKELGISDEEWIKLRNNCWVNQLWSASITPKGAFFCEIAAALDMLFDGPGGWKIEPGWWKCGEKALQEQMHWCELCGMALNTFTRDANEEMDDISPVLYEMLQKVGDPKLGTDHVNILDIRNGIITDESKAKGKLGEGGLHYTDSYFSRYNSKKSELLPEGFEGVLIAENADESIIKKTALETVEQLDKLYILCHDTGLADKIRTQLKYSDKIEINECVNIGYGLYNILSAMNWERYLVIFNENITMDAGFRHLMENLVLNPGTLHFTNFQNEGTGSYALLKDKSKTGYLVMLNKLAGSLKRIGGDGLLGINQVTEFLELWDKNKIVYFSESMVPEYPEVLLKEGMRYAIYGAGNCSLDGLINSSSRLVCAVDTDKKKWGSFYHGIKIQPPDYLLDHRDDYDRIIIGSWIHYGEIVDILHKMGFENNILVSI